MRRAKGLFVAAAVVCCSAMPAWAVEHVVMVDNFTFTPDQVDAAPGDTVRWVWQAGLHTVTSGANCTPDAVPLFDAPIDMNNPQFIFNVPNTPGEIPYFCVFHCVVGMEGNITVVEPPPPGIPTLSEWGMIVMVTLLLGTAGLVIRKRMPQTA